MDTSWVKLYRKIIKNEFLMRSQVAYKLFTVLLCIVDRETGTWSGGRKQLATIAYVKEGSSYKALKALERHRLVTLEGHSLYTTISICKWHHYQGGLHTKDTQDVHNGDTTETHYNNNKEWRRRSNVINSENKEPPFVDNSLPPWKIPEVERASPRTVGAIRKQLKEKQII